MIINVLLVIKILPVPVMLAEIEKKKKGTASVNKENYDAVNNKIAGLSEFRYIIPAN